MEKLSITLPAQMVSHVNAEIAAGRYASTSEYLRSALALKMQQDAEMALIAQRYARIEEHIAGGRLTDGATVFADLRARLSAK